MSDLPTRTVVGGDPRHLPDLPQLREKRAPDGKATAYVCREFTCGPPLQEPDDLREELASAGGTGKSPTPR